MLDDGPADPDLHVLCCNEYFLATQGVPQPTDDSESVAESVRSDLAQPRPGARRFAGGHHRSSR
ncbi:hypothetical protein [Streptomyces sp. Ac-502]|uniref:hypothetical protein n=1 Tax=Streptomyces sp. Ac-502 TaxID=3342801 RepID=UPI0038626DF1